MPRKPRPKISAPPLPEGTVESEFGVPIPGTVLPRERWTPSAIKRWPESGLLDWEAIFGRRAPVVLDLGCGNGRSVLLSATARPDHDHLGVDNLPVVIRYARKRARQRGLGNVRLAVGDARDVVARLVPPHSLAEVCIYHPQPYYDPAEVHRRLITPAFLAQVHRVLAPGGRLVLQTDNPAYWRYICQVVPAFFVLHEQSGPWPHAPRDHRPPARAADLPRPGRGAQRPGPRGRPPGGRGAAPARVRRRPPPAGARRHRARRRRPRRPPGPPGPPKARARRARVAPKGHPPATWRRFHMTASTAPITVRPARPEDIDAIIAITKQVFGPNALECHIARMLDTHGPVSWIDIKAQDLRRELIAGCAVCFVAEMGGRIVGYATNYINQLASRGTIANLAVSAECQGRGVGRLLLERSIDRFRELGLKQAKIETLECNQAGQHLYPSVGFQEVARQIHYVMALD